MPLPAPSDVHINTALSNMSIAFGQSFTEFVSFRVFPRVPVAKQTDSYFIWDRGDFHRDEAKPTGPGAEAPIGALRVSSDSYACVVNKFAHLITEEELANADSALAIDRTKTEDVTRKLMIRKEKDWASKFFTTGKWTGSTTGADLVGGIDFTVWSNYAGSDPVKDIRRQAFQLAKLGLPMKQLKLTIGAEAYLQLLDHPKFLERFEQVQASVLNEQLIASVLGIGEVVVPMSVENTALEGATPAMGFIHGKSALLTYAPPAPAIDVPSAGYSFVWAGLVGGGGEGIRMKRWNRPEKGSDQVQGESAWDHKVTSSVCGVFFSEAVA